jgi:hypothetical protein
MPRLNCGEWVRELLNTRRQMNERNTKREGSKKKKDVKADAHSATEERLEHEA